MTEPAFRLLRAIDSEGYKSTVSFVQAREYGVPQRRGRLIVLASRLGVPGFPEPTHGIGRLPYSTVRDWIADLPPIAAGETHPTVKNHQAAALSELKKRPPSPRSVRDRELKIEIQRVFDENLFVYGADKIWTQLNRENIRVARCTVERLMCQMGLSGARRGKT